MTPNILRSIIFILAIVPALAFARSYHVEAIIFERPEPLGPASAEIWNSHSRYALESGKRLAELKQQASPITVSDKVSILSGVRSKLNDAGYRILRTASWNQRSAVFRNAPLIALGIPGSSLPDAYIRVYKTSLIFVDIAMKLDRQDVSTPATPENENHSADAASANNTANETEQASSTPAQMQPIRMTDTPLPPAHPVFFINEKRRVKFKEIHYFDHPAFGVILGVWPIN